MISARAGWRAALLASVACWPVSVWAGQDAVRVLLEQAVFWRGRADGGRADAALARVLALEPGNADALVLQAQAAADGGRVAEGRAALERLRSAHPDDPRLGPVQAALEAGPLDGAALAAARALAGAGKPAEAVAAYRRAFRGEVPPGAVAMEYYQTLGATPAGYAVGRDGLEALVRANPQDAPAQLAYAQALIDREGTRAEGIDRLAALSALPGVGEAARASWHDALLWSGNDARTQAQLAAYSARYATDAGLDGRRAEIAASIPSAATQARLAGYEAMGARRLDAAARDFTRAIGEDPNDVESLVMLASIRRAQHREAEVAGLLARARAVDAERAGDLVASAGLDRVYGGAGDGGARDGGAAVRRQYAQVGALTRRGAYGEAEAVLRRLMGAHPNAGNLLQLAAIQAQAGRLAAAAGTYRAVLRSQPRNGAAQAGLAGLVNREGGAPAGQADVLRRQAQAAADPAERAALLRRAVEAAPADPWVRLELARVLVAQGEAGEARQVMAGVADGARPSADQVRAALYFAETVHDDRAVTVLAARLPAGAQTAEIRETVQRAEASLDVAEARAAGSLPSMRQRMLALAARPDPTGVRAAGLAQALVRAGDKAGARQVVRTALESTPVPTPQQRLAYAGALVAAGYPAEAREVAGGLQAERLAGAQRAQLSAVRDGAAVVEADGLNGRGKQAEAYDVLAPRLAESPDNADLRLALARLYAGHAEPRRAEAIAQEVLRRHPGNLDAQVAAIEAAVQAGDGVRATALGGQAKAQFPDEPRAFVAAAAAERAAGLNGAALADLHMAKALRAKQLSGMSSDLGVPNWLPGRLYAVNLPGGVMSDVLPDAEPVTREYEQYAAVEPLVPAAPPVPVPKPTLPGPVPVRAAVVKREEVAQNGDGSLDVPTGVNPFRSGAGLTPDEPARAPIIPPDALTSDIDRSIRQITEDVAPRVEASLSVRGRSGQSGLSQLFDVETPLEASYAPGGVGRVRVVLTPTLLFAGPAGQASRVFYGTNPLRQGSGAALGGGSGNAYGAGLDVSYAYGPVVADIGSTPLGFRRSAVVGGVEYSPRLTDTLRLHVLGERRAVTDSVLSFAGARDPATGQDWGGVTRTRGHVQVDGSYGRVSYYVGGGGAVLRGEQVQSNSEVDAGAGFSLPVYQTATQEVRAGLDLVYFAYERNLGGFTLGNGGYFSPQQFFAALVPVTYREQVTPDLSYLVGVSFGAQIFRAKSQAVFPGNAGLQAQLAALAAGNRGVATRLSGFSDTGPAGGARAEVDWRVTGNLHLGAKAGFDRSGNYTEGSGLVYARYVFNDGL